MQLFSFDILHFTFTIINIESIFVYISIHYNVAISNGTFELQTEIREYLLIQKSAAKIKIIETFSAI